ncbi:dihydrolipoamide acetyltransferase family protein [Paramicrobacterium agarici]|uniref:Dihydrolipoamide acetyltransferase component of pyruvate dehydrogenase complex n=1 Tax=Paramicrobacterium agarici TaxID=630514 RepID=A0A2A9DYA6_9MICO|nr:dihydrolipoamide acetyltransferase family protein [Microbacterium agarici]PFG31115.1 pyruvate dehydrogenase E2 component (dihydrolipoamide acetyltransferase) [Microbacterium agarici]
MMIEITMPRLSDTMEEGAIATWHKKAGDTVEEGDVLVEIETDKATMEYEAYESGTLAEILVEEGELVSIGTPIAKLDDGSGDSSTSDDSSDASEDRSESTSDEKPDAADADEQKAEKAEPEAPLADDAATHAAPKQDEAAESDAQPEGERRFASPLVRKLARDYDLDLSKVTGSGPGGRIIRADIDPLLSEKPAASSSKEQKGDEGKPAAKAESKQAPAASADDERRGSQKEPISSIRRVIARRLGESAREIPHFFVTAVADAEELVKLRGSLNEQLVAAGRPKVSVNDLIVRAAALALREHPEVNASYVSDDADHILRHSRVNVGVAVASDAGLMVPVIDDADTKTVTQLGVETKKLAKLANEKKLSPTQMSGGTFTISNLGMFGVEEFTAIINPPEGAILAVGGTKQEAVVVDGEIVARHRMRYTLSSDHRIIDGALAAQFLQTLTRFIENPWTIIA